MVLGVTKNVSRMRVTEHVFLQVCVQRKTKKVRESGVKIVFPRMRVNENVFLQDCVQRKSLQSTLVEMFRARVENSSSVRVMRP